jgi:hypothetical protein
MKIFHHDESKNIASVWFIVVTGIYSCLPMVCFLFEEKRKKETNEIKKRVFSWRKKNQSLCEVYSCI